MQAEPNDTPSAKRTIVSNGDIMYPKTFMMQELARGCFDEALNREDEGKPVEAPFIYTVP